MVGKTDIKAIKPTIEKFKKRMAGLGYGDAEYILYGSWAKGTQTEWSDIDLCVVSSKFGKNYYDEYTELSLEALRVDEALGTVPFRPEDLRDKYDTLASEIRKYGIIV